MVKGKEPRCRERGSAVFLCRRGPTRSRTDGEGCELQAPRGKGARARPSLGIEGNRYRDRRQGTRRGAVSVAGGKGGGFPQAAVCFGRAHSSRRPGPGPLGTVGPCCRPCAAGSLASGSLRPSSLPPAPHEGLTLGTRDGALLVMRGSSALASITMPGAWRALSDLLMNAR